MKIEPKLDLVFERKTMIPAEKIWKGWTDPETLMKWFCPRPWKVTECRLDLRPGGQFYTLMQSPEGQHFPNNGSYLEIIENRKLVWTNALIAGFRPAVIQPGAFAFSATILLSTQGKETLYQAIVSHGDEEGRKRHEQMNFQESWGKAFDQLVELMKN